MGGFGVIRNITEFKAVGDSLQRTLEELRFQTHLMHTVFDTMSDGVIVTDADRKPVIYNRAAESILGPYEPGLALEDISAAYGIHLPDQVTVFPSEELPLIGALRGESAENVKMFVRNRYRPEGVYFSVSARPLLDESGAVTGSVITGRDVTRLERAELDLRRSNRALQRQSHLMDIIFNTISDGVIVADEDEKYLMRNRAAKRLTGEYVPGTTFEQVSETYGLFLPDGATLFPPDDLPLTRAVRHGEPTDDVEMVVRAGNHPAGRYLSVSGRPLRDEGGSRRGGAIVIRDITRIKETESRLRQAADDYRAESQTLQSVFDSIGEAVIVTDDEGEVTRFNPAAERIIGVGMVRNNPERWNHEHGVFFLDRTTPIPHDELPQIRALRGEPVDDMELFLRNPKVPNGVYLNVNANPVRDARGKVQGSVIAFRDVTDRHLAEEALSEAFAEGRLEIIDTLLHNVGNAVNSVATGMGTVQERLRTNRLERRLSALADALEAHRDDLRTYLETDPRGRKVIPFLVALAGDYREHKAELGRIVDRVEERVQHIVDIVRTQKTIGVRRSVRKDVNLRRAIDDAVRILQESIARRGIDVRVDCDRAPDEIRIEESRFHQMLVNLVKNAIEAIDDLASTGGSSGSDGPEARFRIRIDAYVEGDYLVVDVIDNGVGIGPDQLKLIFAPGFTSKVDGSGLGLHASANFAISSGGRIQPLSEGIGKGTTMRVRLRLSSITPGATRAAPPPPPPAADRIGGTNMRKPRRLRARR